MLTSSLEIVPSIGLDTLFSALFCYVGTNDDRNTFIVGVVWNNKDQGRVIAINANFLRREPNHNFDIPKEWHFFTTSTHNFHEVGDSLYWASF